MRERVIKYLMDHYGCNSKEATNFVSTHLNEIHHAELYLSQPYYPAHKIAQLEGLKHLEYCPACNEISKKEAVH